MSGATQRTFEDRVTSMSDVVESLGGGLAQVQLLTLGAGGLFFAMGMALAGFSSSTLAVTREYAVDHGVHSLLMTLSLMGIFCGVSVSGFVADSHGRRLPIMTAYSLLFFCLFVMSFLQTWVGVSLAGLGAGFGIGIGMPASIAMLSENSPVRWRMPLRAATAVLYTLGRGFSGVLCAMSDPTYENLEWRLLLRICASIPAVLLLCCWCCLTESPVFLATHGDYEKAAAGFRTLAHRNGNSISGNFELPPAAMALENGSRLSLSGQLSVIFSQKLWFATLANTFACFVENMALYGTTYASPQILQKASAIPAVYEDLTAAIPSVITIVFVGIFADTISRRCAVILSLALCSSSLFCTCIGGGISPPRPAVLEVIFQYGILSVGVGLAIGITVIYQVAVDIYPSTSSAFGASFIIGFGRLGAVVAGGLFDWMTSKDAFGCWQSYYAMLGICCVVGIIMWSLVSPNAGRVDETEKVEETQNLIVKKGIKHYQTIAANKV
jgi:MFS family permease